MGRLAQGPRHSRARVELCQRHRRPEGKGPRVYLQQMDTPKLGKNRLHIDINASGGLRVPLDRRKEQVDKEVERLVTLGATKHHELDEGRGEYCVVMLDPEGNEFCVQ